MKIIHCADIHLGSKIQSKFPKELSQQRRQQVRNSFQRMVEYAKDNGVEVIMLSGDVFDSNKPTQKDKDFFFSVVERNPEVDFLYLRGNHDHEGERKEFTNLKTFSNVWSCYAYGDVVISGIEMERENAQALYAALSLEKTKKNIVMLHGQEGDASGLDKVNLSKLKNKHIDYLALGHVHEYKTGVLDERGVYAQSGCLEGRGFDETGDKGFILLDVGDKITHTYVPFSNQRIEKVCIDVTGLSDAYAVSARAKKEISFDKNGIYRVELVGEVEATTDEMEMDVKRYLSSECAFIDVKDCTQKRLDINAYEGDTSLKGEFVRNVYADEELSLEDKLQIIAYGLKALDGREVD